MKDFLFLGPTPANEDCAQSLEPNFNFKNQIECRVFCHQLEEQFKEYFPLIRFHIKKQPHDFGTYREVVLTFDDENPEACKAAYYIEENAPVNWTDEAKKDFELFVATYPELKS